jgi:hypothetical protein
MVILWSFCGHSVVILWSLVVIRWSLVVTGCHSMVIRCFDKVSNSG